MFNSQQRYLAQRATTTTDNTPSVTISVNLDLKDTYITNRVSDYASKVYEPKGSDFVVVADVDFEPTETGTYILPPTDEDVTLQIEKIRRFENMSDGVVLNVQPKQTNSRIVEILPTKYHYLEGFSFGAGGFEESLVKAFKEVDKTDGYAVMQAIKNNIPYLLSFIEDGSIVPFARLESTLPPDATLSLPENINPYRLGGDGNDVLIASSCCCDPNSTEGCQIDGWDDTGIPEPFEFGAPSGQWSPQNPCGYLGTSKLCTCSSEVLIVNRDTNQTIYEGSTFGERFEEYGYSSNPNDPNAPSGYRPCGYDPNNSDSAYTENVAVATCTNFKYQENCYTVDPNPLLGLVLGLNIRIPPVTICVATSNFCEKILVHHYGAGCGCPSCPCEKEFCRGDPNCPSTDSPATAAATVAGGTAGSTGDNARNLGSKVVFSSRMKLKSTAMKGRSPSEFA